MEKKGARQTDINRQDKNTSQGIGFQRGKYILLCHILSLII